MANFIGTADPDFLAGTPESDLIEGQESDDTLVGFAGNDTLVGNSENDSLHGGRDNDLLQGGQGNDSLFGELDNDTLGGDQGNDFVFGNEDDDFIADIGGNDTLYGGLGNDTILNLEGDDQLFGDRDNDILYVGLGANTLTGGAGADLFVIGRELNGGQTDIIADFRPGFDLIALADDLEFEDLEFVQAGNNTVIVDRESREELAILEATQNNTLIRSSFTKSIATVTSVVEFGEQSVQIGENQASGVVEIGIQRGGSPLNTVGAKLLLSDANSSSDDLEFPPAGIDVVFAPFETFKRVAIPINNDGEFEGDESIALVLADPTGGATIGGQSEFILNIQDDDPPPPTPTPTPTPTPEEETPDISAPPPIFPSDVSVSVSPAEVAEDGGGELVYTFTRSAGSLPTGIIVDFAVGGNARLGTDYTAAGAIAFSEDSGQVVFVPNSATAQVVLTPVANDIFEADKTVELTVAESGILYEADPVRPSATGTILNDDEPPDPPVYDFARAEFLAVEGDPDNPQRAEITVRRSADVDLQSRVDVILTGGTAVEGTDYTSPPQPTPLVFLPGETEQSVFVDLIPNSEEQPARNVNLSFANFQIIPETGDPILGGQAGVTDPTATLTINDDDGPITYEFAGSLFTAPEGNALNTVEVVEVVRTGRLSAPSTVTVNLQGINNATPDVDFAADPIAVNFAADQSVATVPVEIIGNVDPEGNKTLRLSLSAPPGENIGTNNPDTELIIIDDDDIPTYDFTTGQYTAREEDGTTEAVTVIRAGNAQAASSVDVVLTPADTNGAAPGEDIDEPERITLNFAPGQTIQTVPLDIINDTVEEEDEVVRLSFENFAPEGQRGNTFPTANLVILDNDSPPVYNFSQAAFATPEGDGVNTTSVVEVLRSGETTNASRVDVVLTQGTAAADSDYTDGPITINFAPDQTTQTVPIQILGDDRVENDETVELSFANFIVIGDNGEEVEIGRAGTLQPESVLTLENDDVATVSIRATADEAVEADPGRQQQAQNGTFQIQRSPEAANPLTVNLTVSGNRLRLDGNDYALQVGDEIVPVEVDAETNTGTATVTIPTDQLTLDVALVALDDLQAEADESLTLTIGEIDDSEYVIDSENNQATVTIVANDTEVTRLTDSSATDEQAYFDGVEGSLRQALINAEAFSGANTITFAPPPPGNNTINLVAALPNITEDLIIDGPGANRLTVRRSDAQGTPNFRIFTISGGDVIFFEGLTIANGIAPGTNFGGAGGVQTGSRGGAINVTSSSSTVNITNSVVTGSQANNGGGIANSGTLNITNSTISDNRGVNGGGIVVIDGSVNVTNSTVAQNTADLGGGIFNSIALLTLTNSTVALNTANSRGGGVRNIGGSVNLRNTLIAGNTLNPPPNSTATEPDLSTSTDFPATTGGNNLIGDAAGVNGLTNGVNGDLVGVDALLVPQLANNGGLTPTIALEAGSPAIDAGNAEFSGGFTNPQDFDQRGEGFPRIVDIAGMGIEDPILAIDIGAFEVQV